MRNLKRLQVRVNAIVLEALQRPVTRASHLRRSRQPWPNAGSQILQILHQLGMSLHLVIDLLVGLLHSRSIDAFVLIGSFSGATDDRE